MKRPHLAAGLLAATLLAGACGSTDSDTSSPAPTTTATSTPPATTSASSSPPTTSEESAAAAASPATAGEPYSFPGYRQACLEALKSIEEFDAWNKKWDPNAADIDADAFIDEVLAAAPLEPDFQAMSKSEQDQFVKAYRAAATGRC